MNDQRMIYIEGRVDLETYQRAYSDKQSRIDKKIVFVFPGNPTHHTPGTTMFTVKRGGGLAHYAGLIGEAGFPVLSLPTTGLEGWTPQENNRDHLLANRAVADLYKAIAEGYRLMIPVRPHEDNEYFDAPLQGTDNKEPSFWKGIQRASNKPLANMYALHLDNLRRFTDDLYSLGEEAALENLTQLSPYFAKVYVAARVAIAPASAPVFAPVFAPASAPASAPSKAQLAIQALDAQLVIIKEKANQLRLNKQEATAVIAERLRDTIKDQAAKLMIRAITKSAFDKNCADAIKTARPALEKFGWKEILGNLALAILGLGVVYLAACTINKAVTGHFFFFRTDAGQALNGLEEKIAEVVEPVF